ncbi:MAG: 4a-hydroxytetrahydrobiopterin dehydratase [Eudoraea sp.]
MQKLTETEITEKLRSLTDWHFKDGSISREAKFANFKDAFSVMTRIAFECEAQNHHPNWSNVYNTLLINLNTHDVGGITEKDFKLAQTIETILTSQLI